MSALPPIASSPVVVFANDWSTDPTSKHHLMRLLSAHTEVLWVETSGMRKPQATNSGDLRRIFRKVGKMFGSLRVGAPNLRVLTPPSIPNPTSRWIQRCNAWLARMSITRALRAMGRQEEPVLWVYTPTAARYLHLFPERRLVYHCVDRWWAFAEYDADEMRACHEILCRRADVVFASSRELVADCEGLARRVVYLPHGVEWAAFRTALDTTGATRPADLPSTSGPIVALVGLIDSRINLPLLRELAEARPDATLVIIGSVRVPVDQLAGLPNVHFLGQKPFRELPAYLAWCAVALIPYVLNDQTRAINPIKLREYLSAGLPVVSSELPDLEGFRGHPGVDLAPTNASFVAAVGNRIDSPPSASTRHEWSEGMRHEGWEGRLVDIFTELNGVVWASPPESPMR